MPAESALLLASAASGPLPALGSPLLTLVVATPLLLALVLRLAGDRRWTRGAALAGLALDLGLALAALAELHQRGASRLGDAWLGGELGDMPLLALDHLSAALLPFAIVIGAVAVTVAPRVDARPGLVPRLLLALALTLAIFATLDPRLLALLWALSLLPPLLELRGRGPSARQARRVFAIYMGASALAFAAGLALRGAEEPALASLATGLLVAAVMIRKGITPLHSWSPAFFEHAPLGPAILFTAPQVGAYALARVVLPDEPALVLRGVAAAALVTAVYGAAMATTQADARRAYGYLFISQSALVVVGFECVSLASLSGGLTLWLSSGLALAGLGMTLWVLEARRGRLRLDRFHGGYEKTPLLAALFILLGIASVGFPGTLGFIGEELLIDGAVLEFPLLGFAVALASALGGVALMRAYFALFTGRAPRPGPSLFLRPRETLGFALLGALVLVLGLWPRPLIADRAEVARALLEARGDSGSLGKVRS